MAQDPSKTEKPTGKRIKKAREDGSVAKSEDLSKAAVLAVGVFSLLTLFSYIANKVAHLFRYFLGEHLIFTPTQNSVYELLLMLSSELAFILLPFFFCIMLAAFIILRVQVGKLWTTKVFKPKFGKIFNLAAGLKRLVLDPQVFLRLGKNLLMAIAVGYAPYIVLRDEMPKLQPLFFATPAGIAQNLLELAYRMTYYALIPMLLIGIADYVYQRWRYTEGLKMSKQEVKDEARQAEGNPEIKQKQRRKMMESMAARMMQNVPKADVIVTNPTHYAIALRYDALEAPAPVVLAKGINAVAERIKEIARENNIPIRENKPLAQALYKQVEIGDIIPEEMYKAVASILAKIKRAGRTVQRDR
ncbi:MAG: flagellar biosynthesis protein FlhB [Desulfovibrio sp.]|uniref:flagellar biosynthesis protein FlhB n=1 Tax=Desulfovibrio sp. 7SRBS1 TaxID=3378064 RepID=UPI003B3FBADD